VKLVLVEVLLYGCFLVGVCVMGRLMRYRDVLNCEICNI